jgi:hypothetical protein
LPGVGVNKLPMVDGGTGRAVICATTEVMV